MKKPLLSVGLIFKNEIRCLERCLKSLQPLRELIPMEIVMADTGSDDGSREVAEKYADIVFDFPWINDFSAARNAVMDRCSGDWYFSIDADEWLGGKISELADFVRISDRFSGNVALMTIYNYSTYEVNEDYSEFRVVRLVRMSTGLRFEGSIHERWPYETSGNADLCELSYVLLHHDGYAGLYQEEGKAKRARNVALLREELKQNPDDLRRLLQYVESAGEEPDYMEKLRRGLKLASKKCLGWNVHGQVLFRYAVIAASNQKLPELEEWVEEAQRLYPDSLFTKIDVAFFHFAHVWDQDQVKAIPIGESCLQAMVDLREGRLNKRELGYSILMAHNRQNEQELIIFLAEGHRSQGHYEKCIDYLNRVEYRYLDEMRVKRLTRVLIRLHTQSGTDTVPLVRAVWEGVQERKPSQERAMARRGAFLQEAATEFQGKAEEEKRTGYSLFLPLADQCEAGRAAQMLELSDAAALEQVMLQVQNWNELPIQALIHALNCGAYFPLPDKPMQIEEMDGLAGRITAAGDATGQATLPPQEPESLQALCWRRSLLLAAIRACKWEDEAQGMALARAFAAMEREFIPTCYAPAALTETALFLLPSMHRFGWYCAQAFEALDAGDAAGYVRLLRKGLANCESMKGMVEFLTQHTPELQAPPPSAEMQALADQIRVVLSNFAPDDPAVVALKQSEAYQKVAYLIEGIEPPVIGGLKQ